eukprot:CAMPEP_0196585448 /NCGR_PEP_ID=MMETSP1081-20130531/50694_1 /TAXON_ID=36882 /ORGANISM="Pyramimonas amylifera, Strain CCMP720" /LENGTH=334 /DNA_ID=CAMNT_0041906989 /DNA_START=135 /DNA_END=1139 /DNA_ORIENTATION=-
MSTFGSNLDGSIDLTSVGATRGSCGSTINSDLNDSVDVTSMYVSRGESHGVSGRITSGRLASSRPIYELEAIVGSGKYSTVYRATRTDNGKLTAVKKVQVFDMDSSTRSDCITEVKLLQALDHPNIIKYLDSFIQDNELIIELEFAEGGDLAGLLEACKAGGRTLPEEQVWRYFTQVVSAAHHMHERRMMHRDIKPSNVFVTLGGTLKLGDLGLSRHFSSKTLHVCSAVGTPYYMSPEVIRGLPYDWSSDVWSLGCLLYELASLRNPFYKDDLNFYQLGKNINNCIYEPLPDSLSPELRTLTCQMLQQDPKLRPSIESVLDLSMKCLQTFKPIL